MILTLILTLLTLLYLTNTLSIALFTTLSQIPNAHWSAPYSRFWLFWLKYKGKEHRTRYALHLKLGPVIRLAPRELSVNCIENGVKTVYNSGWDMYKGIWFRNMRNFGSKYRFSTTSEKAHKERKKMLSHPFNINTILDSPQLDSILNTLLFKRLLPQIYTWSQSDQTTNVLRETKAFSMDVTSAYNFGLENGTNFIENADQKDLIGAFEKIAAEKEHFWWWWSEIPIISTLLVAAFAFLKKGISEEHTSTRGLRRFEEEVRWECKAAKEKMTLNEKSSSVSQNATVYAHFRRTLEEDSRIRHDDIDEIMAAEMWHLLRAGHESPGITLAYLMAELSKNPLAQGILMKELRSLRRYDGKYGILPSAKEIDNLPYLDAVIWETMRLYPPSLGPFPCVVPATFKTEGGTNSQFEAGTRLGDFEDIPPGTNVSASPYALHRNPQVFENPEVWRPERWLDGKVARSELKKWWWAFGSGTMGCTGNHLSFRMMKAFVVAVYENFDPYLVATVEEQVDGVVGAPGGNRVLMKFFHSGWEGNNS